MTEAQTAVLCFRVQDQNCALPLDCVAETLRPQPLKSASPLPAFVCGLSMIRGSAVPVLDMAALLGAARLAQPARLILLRLGARAVALAVEAVEGVRLLAQAKLQDLPPLLRDADETVTALAARDRELLLLLRPGRLLSAAQDEGGDAH